MSQPSLNGFMLSTGFTPARGASMARAITRLAGVALVVGSLAGCNMDGAVAPEAAKPQLEIVSPPQTAVALKRTIALAHDITVSQVIDRRGGSIRIPEAGLEVIVPSGALILPVKISATALAGDLVAYNFGPHGLLFLRPLEIRQDYRNTNLQQLANYSTLEAGYFASPLQIDRLLSLVQINEFLPVNVDFHGSRVQFNVWHFSGYMLSTGRKK